MRLRGLLPMSAYAGKGSSDSSGARHALARSARARVVEQAALVAGGGCNSSTSISTMIAIVVITSSADRGNSVGRAGGQKEVVGVRRGLHPTWGWSTHGEFDDSSAGI